MSISLGDMIDPPEDWIPVLSYPGYEASTYGRVRSKCKILSQNFCKGYLVVQLNKVKGRVNRLVCEAFHGPAPSDKHEAAHRDNHKTNNNEDNLYWATSSQNKLDTAYLSQGENNGRAKLDKYDVKDIRLRRSLGEKLDSIHRSYPQVSRSMVAYIYQGKSWKHLL